jgi:hypothetical protein
MLKNIFSNSHLNGARLGRGKQQLLHWVIFMGSRIGSVFMGADFGGTLPPRHS